MKLVTLDRRHTGWGTWKYFVPQTRTYPEKDGRILFYRWREWCWSTWGPSKELEEFSVIDDLFDGRYSSNPYWCWGYDQKRIYLGGDLEASKFSLQWS